MAPSYRIVFYVSGHGFGHASRVVEVIHAVARLRPDVSIAVKTSAPRGLFVRTLGHTIDFVHQQCDTGLVQLDSLHLDEAESIRQAEEFHARLSEMAGVEAGYLRASSARLVVGDIPPLAFAAAAAAGLPSIAIGNFTWDWIYEGYPEQRPAGLVRIIRESSRKATAALRLPLAGGFEGLDEITRDIPFVARRSKHDPADIRRRLGLPAGKPIVLMAFGGYGLAGFHAGSLEHLQGYTFVSSEIEQRLYDHGYGYEDLVHAADVVVTKPGYGIISEAIANDAALLYTSRGRFAEYDVLVREMPKYLRAQFIGQEDLLAGRWGPALEHLLAQPKPSTKPALNGAEVAAEAICGLLKTGN